MTMDSKYDFMYKRLMKPTDSCIGQQNIFIENKQPMLIRNQKKVLN